jgi:hypothetical protein
MSMCTHAGVVSQDEWPWCKKVANTRKLHADTLASLAHLPYPNPQERADTERELLAAVDVLLMAPVNFGLQRTLHDALRKYREARQ